MNYNIQTLSALNHEDINAICDLLKTAYQPAISSYLLYNDKSYINYLKSAISNHIEIIYTARKPDSNALMGFAQIRYIGENIHLNNIIIKEEFRGKGLAQLFLRHIWQTENNKAVAKQLFTLDVFENNHQAVNWYKRIGMEKTSESYWYNLIRDFKTTGDKVTEQTITLSADHFGFTQVLYNEAKIATLINNQTLLFRSGPTASVLVQLNRFFGDDTKHAMLITGVECNYPLIDKSFRMEMPFKKLNRI